MKLVTTFSDGGQLRSLKKIAKALPQEVAGAMVFVENQDLTKMKDRTPVEFGILMNTGKVENPIFKGSNIKVEITFGGPAAPYAFFVHEDPDAFHPIGQWKFMESVQDESHSTILQRLATRIQLRKVV